MHRSCGRVGVASCALLTGLVETAGIGITGFIAIDRHTDTATVDIIVGFHGIVVPARGFIVCVRKISLAPGTIELTIFVPVADLREGKLTIRGDADDSLVVSRKIEKEPGVAARAGHGPTGSLIVIANFVPQSDGDWAIGSEGDGVIVTVGIAIAQGY